MLNLLIIGVAFSAGAYGDIYKYQDSTGEVYLTDAPMKGPYELIKVFRDSDRSSTKAIATKPKPAADSVTLAIQSRLRKLGYAVGPVDGVAGPKTIASIKEFQNDSGLAEDGMVTSALLKALDAAIDMQQNADGSARKPADEPKISPRVVRTGSGFFVSPDHLVTNTHVVIGCRKILIHRGSVTSAANVVKIDKQLDLALLASEVPNPFSVTVKNRDLPLGAAIVVAGFPLRGLLSAGLAVTTGSVSALSGIADDDSLYQISAPVHPGNSGGPLLGPGGNVAGVVIGKLNALMVARVTGDVPQNINFALKGSVLLSFLRNTGVALRLAEDDLPRSIEEIAQQAEGYTSAIECFE